jgi:hypothetical protein
MTANEIITELIPISSRLELEDKKWVARHFPPNLGAKRDIPDEAEINDSVTKMLHDGILDQSMKPIKGGGSSFWQNCRNLLGFGKRKASAPAQTPQQNGGP